MKRSNSGNAENMFEGANVGRIVSTFILRDALHGFVRVKFRMMWMFRCFRFSHSQQRKSGAVEDTSTVFYMNRKGEGLRTREHWCARKRV